MRNIMVSFLSFTKSKYLFYSILLVNIILLFFTKFYPSMDGPAHLYNSSLLASLIKGNPGLSEFYSINSVAIPNWTSHFILGFFHLFFSAWLAEKAFLILYVSGMALSFRFLIKELNPENISLSILIFPFIYSFLFHLGFYNFNFSFILFFTSLGFWLRIQKGENPYNIFILFLLITITYFCNVLMYGFLGLLLALYILYFGYLDYRSTSDFFTALKVGGKKLLILFIASLPSLIFLLIFYMSVSFSQSDSALSSQELVKWINDARPFIVYDYLREENLTEQFSHVLLLLLVISFMFKIKGQEDVQNISTGKQDLIAIPLAISVILLFMVPSGSSAGMMSDRFSLIVFILWLLWTVSRAIPHKFNAVIILFVLLLHFGLHRDHYKNAIRNLDKNAVTIQKTAEFIPENSIVLPIKLSDNWLELHFSNYLGVDKPMVILENYEASVGWFPVKYKSENFPNIVLGDRNSIGGIHWRCDEESKNIKQIDYIFLYGNMDRLNEPKWTELKGVLHSGFSLKFISDNNYIMLYERIY